MNTTILQKVITELKTEKPRLDYVLGMLETMLEMQPSYPTLIAHSDGEMTTLNGNKIFPARGNVGAKVVQHSLPPVENDVMGSTLPPAQDEASILDAKARAAIKSAQEMGQITSSSGEGFPHQGFGPLN